MTEMADEGYPVTPELISRLSPYVRQHIRRFGQYVLDMEDKPEPLQPKPVPLPPSQTEMITFYTYSEHTPTCHIPIEFRLGI